MDRAVRIITRIGIVATIASAVIYALSIAGMVFPIAWLLALGFPILAITALIYILRSAAARESEVSLRWWMPVVWTGLVVNEAIVSHLADGATKGGHVEYPGGHAVLVVHGQVVRALDAAGVRAVALWDTRAHSSLLLLLLAFASLGLLALSPARRDANTPAPAP